MQDLTVPQSKAAEIEARRRAAYEIVVAGVSAGLPLPELIGLYNFGVLEVQVPDDAPEAVDAWRTHLGLPEPTLSTVIRGSARPFRSYESGVKSFPGLPGWNVKVFSFVDVTEDGTR